MTTEQKQQKGTVDVHVRDAAGAQAAIIGAAVRVSRKPEGGGKAEAGGKPEAPSRLPGLVVAEGVTNGNGAVAFELPAGAYEIRAEAHGLSDCQDLRLRSDCRERVELGLPFGFTVETFVAGSNCTRTPCNEVREGQSVFVSLSWQRQAGTDFVTSLTSAGGNILPDYRSQEDAERVTREYIFHASRRGVASWDATLRGSPELHVRGDLIVLPNVQSVAGDMSVTMRRAATEPTEDLPLWVVIRKSTEALSFNNYARFMNHVLCGEPLPDAPSDFETQRFPKKKEAFDSLLKKRFLPFTDTEAYRILKTATEAFVAVNCGVALDDFPFDQADLDYVTRRVGRNVDLDALWDRYLVAVNGTSDPTLPYLGLIRAKLADVRIKEAMFGGADLPEECFGILREKLLAPCLLELIWSYWHEEGMLVQTMNAITRRFQNVRGPREPDPLANLEIDPLRPLNNLFWGMVQDEQHRLTVVRRNYEYDHHYGLRLEGKAVRELRAADTRSKFLEAFHNLLNLCAGFFKQDDDTTIVADGFPLLNGLKDVHLILSQGAHNQFGDLPSTARIEMLMQQWMLARPEFREFLPTRIMVAYPEPWMDRVDAMKKLQGWTDTSVLQFRNLAMFGEQVLLSIRYGAWSDANDPAQAANWARFWRPEIQGYTHAYRAVTGVDLTAANVGGAVDFTLPATLLQRRLAAQPRSA
ncbi:hypothetical protein [Thauera sp. WH-1]|uniref:hypothetical protein n=1 Tax=Thauera sp. WH-1 TaxID=3398230 RepID=UPI0039FD6494